MMNGLCKWKAEGELHSRFFSVRNDVQVVRFKVLPLFNVLLANCVSSLLSISFYYD